MGKGDRKTAKGKRYNSSYGNVRGRGVPAAAVAAAPAAPAKKAAKTTKTVAKKTVTKAAKSAE